jgi:metal transporter CNNM
MYWKVCHLCLLALYLATHTRHPELIGEEIYDEFDLEGQSRLKSYAVPKPKSKRRPSRGLEAPVHPFPVTVPNSATAVSQNGPGGVSVPRSHSQPTSPTLSTSHEDDPVSRTPLLGRQLSALAIHRRIRNGSAGGTPSSAQTGWRTSRERSQQHKSKSEGEMAEVGLAPLSTPPARISEVQEEPERIPDEHEKSGPDKLQSGGEEKKA